MPKWVFWVLIIIVLFLSAVILSRDKGIRQGIKNIFARLKKKIRVARIKAKINRENEKMRDLLKNLGQETWSKGIAVGGVEEEVQEAKTLQDEKAKMESEIGSLNSEIEKNRKSWEEFNKKQNGFIKDHEKKREPLAAEFNKLKKSLDEWEKELHEKEKLKSRIEKKLSGNQKKIEEIESDEYLSKIEKKEKRTELENAIKELEINLRNLGNEHRSLNERGPQIRSKLGEIEPKVRELDGRIKSLKDEQKSEEKRVDEIIADQRKRRNTLIGQKTLTINRLDALFEKIGKKVNRSRVENTALSGLYAQIDSLNKVIRELESQLSSED